MARRLTWPTLTSDSAVTLRSVKTVCCHATSARALTTARAFRRERLATLAHAQWVSPERIASFHWSGLGRIRHVSMAARRSPPTRESVLARWALEASDAKAVSAILKRIRSWKWTLLLECTRWELSFEWSHLFHLTVQELEVNTADCC